MDSNWYAMCRDLDDKDSLHALGPYDTEAECDAFGEGVTYVNDSALTFIRSVYATSEQAALEEIEEAVEDDDLPGQLKYGYIECHYGGLKQMTDYYLVEYSCDTDAVIDNIVTAVKEHVASMTNLVSGFGWSDVSTVPDEILAKYGVRSFVHQELPEISIGRIRGDEDIVPEPGE